MIKRFVEIRTLDGERFLINPMWIISIEQTEKDGDKIDAYVTLSKDINERRTFFVENSYSELKNYLG